MGSIPTSGRGRPTLGGSFADGRAHPSRPQPNRPYASLFGNLSRVTRLRAFHSYLFLHRSSTALTSQAVSKPSAPASFDAGPPPGIRRGFQRRSSCRHIQSLRSRAGLQPDSRRSAISGTHRTGPGCVGVIGPLGGPRGTKACLQLLGAILAAKDWVTILPLRTTNVSVATSYTLSAVSAVHRMYA